MIICESLSGKPYAVAPERVVFRPSVYALIPYQHALAMVTIRSTGKYGLPGGAVEPHEHLADALHREVREETGLTIDVGNLLHFKETFFYYDPTDTTYHTLSFFYHCQPRTVTFLPDHAVDDGDVPEAQCPRWIDPVKLAPEAIQGFFQAEVMAFLPHLRPHT